jgi:deoxyribonuclease V
LKNYREENDKLKKGKLMDVFGIPPQFSIEKAHETQLSLSRKIIFEDRLPRKIRFVAGVDAAYLKNRSIGAVTVLDYDTLEMIESQTVICETRFPYVPTLLAFREIMPAVASIKKLHLQPDVFLVDGHGVAHPYRCGLASHLGLVIQRPTIGVAKSKLVGEIAKYGDKVYLVQNKEVIGSMITTKSGSKPIYVSVGHMVSLETATKIVKHCLRGNRIPEPILRSHKIAAEEKKKNQN